MMDSIIGFLSSREIIALTTFGTLSAFAIQALRWLTTRCLDLFSVGSLHIQRYLRQRVLARTKRNRRLMAFDSPVAAALSDFLFRSMAGFAVLIGGIVQGGLSFSAANDGAPYSELHMIGAFASLFGLTIGMLVMLTAVDNLFQQLEWIKDPSRARSEALIQLGRYRNIRQSVG